MTAGETHQIMVRYLPDVLISSNTWSDNRAKALAIHAEKEQITVHTIHAIREHFGPTLPHWDAVTFSITYCHTNKRLRDGIYRPVDPSNIGGTIQKAVVDAFTPEEFHKDGRVKKLGTGIIDDDSHPDFREKGAVVGTALGLEKVAERRDEGILVVVQELVGANRRVSA